MTMNKTTNLNWDNLILPAGQVDISASTPGNNNPLIGIGGAPTRASTLPDKDPRERKVYPVATGFMDYFPDAIVAISNISYRGNLQHHKDKPLHWDRSKSADEADTMMRHFLQRGTFDTDGVRHSAKMCWRALALLQKEIEAAAQIQPITTATIGYFDLPHLNTPKVALPTKGTGAQGDGHRD